MKKESPVYLVYVDANNLYGWAMSLPLPTINFMWVENVVDFDVVSTDSCRRYIFVINLGKLIFHVVVINNKKFCLNFTCRTTHRNYMTIFKDWCFMNSQPTFLFFNLFLTQLIMVILSKGCKQDNFEPHNSVKKYLRPLFQFCSL